MSKKITINGASKTTEFVLPSDQADCPVPTPIPEMPRPYRQSILNPRTIILSIFWMLIAIVLIVSSWITLFSPEESIEVSHLVLSPTRTPPATPSATFTATPQPTLAAAEFTILGLTPTPTPVPGGQVLILKPVQRGVGWVVSDDESIVTIYDAQNHFDDSFLYAGVLDEKIYHGAIQFDLSHIPRGTKIYAASVKLTGLREELMSQNGSGSWRLQLLASELDQNWNTANYEQLHRAPVLATIGVPLTPSKLGKGKVNLFEFTPEQLTLLERRILETNEEFEAKVSFRLDGPVRGGNNLFGWDSGDGQTGSEPELFLSLGPLPQATTAPYYVVITSTPTPENIMTAVAHSLQLTAEATRIGTATPLPAFQVTPIVVTPTATPENRATAQVMSRLATAAALTTGEPINVVTATPTPTYVIITSTPTPENIMTAVANSLQLTAEATRVGTVTPLPSNWVTPVVVTATPTPENSATLEYWQIANQVTGTPTPLPANAQTATPTPTFVIITSTPTPEDIMTAAAISQQITAEAAQFGTATPLPTNWVTPVVVTLTPIPANTATTEYQQAMMLTTGTPTPTPANVQTATLTPVFITVEPLASLTPTATPSATPRPIPDVLLGKIVFLSDREGATEEERLRAGLSKAAPRVLPQPYVYDPETGQIGRLTDIWPYEVAAIRDAWSVDATYEAYNQKLLWTNVEKSIVDQTVRIPTTVYAIHYYDHKYKVERQVTDFGAGWAWDPAWSPVGDQIAFVSNDSADDEIWVINSDGTNAKRLTETNEAFNAREIGKDTFIPELNGHPSWSPDGSQIVFWSNRTGNRQIWIMNVDGSEERILMEWNPYNDWDPVWIKYTDPAPPLEREPDWRFRKPLEEGQGSN